MKQLKKFISIFLCLAMLIVPLNLWAGNLSYDPEAGAFRFDSEDMLKYFSSSHSVSLSYNSNEDALEMKVTGGDPYALLDFSKVSGSLNTSNYKYAVLTYKVPSGTSNLANTAEIFISAGSVGGPTAGKSVFISLSRGAYVSYIIDLASLSWWSGQIHSMRIDCFCSSNSGDIMYVDSLILCKDSATASAIAAERENRNFENDPYRGTDLECINYDVTKYTSPFWKGNIVYNEAVSPIQNADGSYTYELMYTPDEIISVYSGTYSAYYEEGEDYTVSGNKLTVLSSGSIPTWTYGYVNRSSYDNSDGAPLYAQIGGGYGIYGINSIFMEGYLNVTYTHSDTWDHYAPTSKADLLPNTADAIRNNENYDVLLFGDSIAGGAVSSKYRGYFPYADYWYEQIESCLRQNYGFTNLSFSSVSEGGQSASGMVDYFEQNILPENPDLYILEFGVNDAQNESVSSTPSISNLKYSFKNGLEQMIMLAKDQNPDCEILLVSPFYSNITFFREEMFEACRDACIELEQEYDGVAVANVTDVQGSLMEHKMHYNFMGDNLCHPNDYMARIFAQTCIATIIPDDLGYEAYIPEGMQETTISSISIGILPSKTSYVEGQEISFSGLKLLANYSDGTSVEVTPDSITYDKNAVGTVKVTVTYGELSTDFNITVAKKVVSYIEVTAPYVTYFHAGNDLDLTGGKVKVTYASTDAYSEDIFLDSSMIRGYDKNKAGLQTITVTYGGKTDTFEVETYVKYTSMEIILSPGCGYIMQGENIYPEHYNVTYYCEAYPQFNKTTKLTENMLPDNIDVETPGHHEINITSGDLTATLGYTVMIRGDIDGDDEITMIDLYKMKTFLAQTGTPSSDDPYEWNADIDGDGDITMLDSYELKYRISNGIWRN